MLKLRRQSVWVYVDNDPKHTVTKWLHKKLTISTMAYVKGRVTFHKRRLFNLKRKRFPAGLLQHALKMAKKNGIEVDLKDERPEVPEVLPLPELKRPLYDYQEAAVEQCIKLRNGIVKLPTGSGKTEVAIAFALRVNCPVLFLADEKGLAHQAMERWEDITGEPAGIIGEGIIEIQRFTVGTLQTLRDRLRRKHRGLWKYVTDDVKCVIFDECHILGARSYFKTAVSIPNAVYRIGLSATPTGRSDKRDAYVVGATGPIVYTETAAELVKLGRLSPGTVIFYRYPGANQLEMSARNWHKLYYSGIVRSEARNRALIRICKVTPSPILMFFEQKRHGYQLLSMLEDAGFTVGIVHGKHKREARTEAAQMLGAGKTDVLLASKILTKGWDIPQIKSVVNAAGYKAVITAIQKLGRGTRVSEGKQGFFYWDLVDGHHATLLRHSRTRARTYKNEGYDVRVVDTLKDAVQEMTPECSNVEPKRTRSYWTPQGSLMVVFESRKPKH